ncbi:11282_t:CDS:2, partial [Scutellospora calospora]
MSQYAPYQLVFSDETAFDRRTLLHRYGALCIDGLLAYSIQESSMNTNNYENFIEHVLLPKINTFSEQYSVLVLDNTLIL